MTFSLPVRIDLHDGWSLRAVSHHAPAEVAGREIDATVPGCVHTDLLAAGLIPDPFHDNNEALLAWIGLTDWEYRTRFDFSPEGHTRHDLVFDGLDTVATVRLNGSVVLESANQHRTYRVDARDALVDGSNELVVTFASPVRYANAKSLEYGARPRPYPLPYEAIRKSAFSFGWDWGIRAPSSGIWRGVRIESWSVARIDGLVLRADVAGDDGVLTAEVSLERDEDAPLAATVEVAGERVEVPTDEDRVTAQLRVPGVEKWWPVGHGDQPLYDARIAIAAPGRPIDETRRRIGFRTVSWNSEPDEHGTPFELFVNGRRIYVKGVNWIPDDAFVTRIDRERYRARLAQARAAGVNLVRVWGGGIYESDDFYDACDELGLLSWQDFLFACAAYPEDDELWHEVEAEARDNAARLHTHPSLVLLAGNNENLFGYEEWGWQAVLDGRTWGAGYYYDLLPRVAAEAAPGTPYIPGSPFAPGGQGANDEKHGTVHLWEQWNRRDWRTYAEHEPRFVAEFGWQGPAAWTTLRDALSDDPLTPESPGMLVHQKAIDGGAKLTAGLVAHARVPNDTDTWHWAMQWNQANAIRFALEHFRSLAPRNSGAIVWQLNDCWPVTSWSAIDGAGRLKPLWHALRQAYAPRAATVHPREGGLALVLDNDTADPWWGTARIERIAFDGTVLETLERAVDVPPRGSASLAIPESVGSAGHAAREAIVATVGDTRAVYFFAEVRDSSLEPARVEAAQRSVEGGTEVRVTAHNLVRDLCLLADRAVAGADARDGLVTLLPGETRTFVVRHPGRADEGAFARPDVLRSANDLVRGAGA